MKKLMLSVATLTLFVVLIPGGQGMAAPHLWGSQVNPGKCGGPPGRLLINITHQVINDGDSGLGGYWAYDDYNRHIQVWQVDADTFCVDVRYLGSFETVAGASPGNTDIIAAGIDGTFQGGYRASIAGTPNPNPAFRTRGNIGTFDYGWDGHSDHGAHTPFSWLGAYFSSVSDFTYEWWGWIYQAGSNGTWTNSTDGNQGDITD